MKKFKRILSLILAVMMVLTVMPFSSLTAFSLENNSDAEDIVQDNDYPSLYVGDEVTVIVEDDYVYYYFTPETDGYYTIYSEGSSDAYCTVYDSNDDYYADNDDYSGLDFAVIEYFYADETYLVEFGSWSGDDEFTVYVEEATVEANPVESIEYISGEVVIIENTNGTIDYYYDFENDEEVSYFCYYTDITSDVYVQINYNDGTPSRLVNLYEEVSVDGYYFDRSSDQMYDRWVVGGDNYMTITYRGASTQIPVIIEANPVESIEIVSGEIALIENCDGLFNERYNVETGEWEEFFYYSFTFPDDVMIQINYKDGTSEIVNFYDDNYDFEWNYNQHTNPWVIGGDYNYVVIEYLGSKANLPVVIQENPVESIEYVSGQITLLEEMNGFTDTYYNEDTEEYEEYFRYWFGIPEEVMIKINYTDGTSETVSASSLSLNTSDNQPWVVGGDNYVEIDYLGATTQIPVVIEANPIESIEIASGEIALIENYNGYYDTRYNDETGEDEEIFYYWFAIPDDIFIQINYNDGTSEIVNIYDEDYYDDIEWSSNQYENPWVIDGENYLTVYYYGFEAYVPVIIEANPVESIELVSGEIALVENYGGCYDTYYNEETGEYEEFYWYSYSIPVDTQIQINYIDGTSETVNFYDDNYKFNWYNNQYENPWVIDGDYNYVTIEYYGFEAYVPVVIKTNPIESIELATNSVITLVENGNGYYDTRYNDETGEDEEFFYYWYDIPEDVMIKINYTDGTSQTISKEDEEFIFDVYFLNDQYNYPWVSDGDYNYVIIEYYGVTTQLPVVITENPVESIEINSAPTKEYIYGEFEYGFLDNNGCYYLYPYDMTGLSFTVYYKDGTSKTYTDADIDEYDEIDGYSYSLDYSNPAQIGDFPITFTYMGQKAEYTVTILEATVESIELTKAPTQTQMPNKYYLPTFIGAEFTITYTDGSTQVVAITEDNVVYNGIDGYVGIEVDGYPLAIFNDYTNFCAQYINVDCEIDCITYANDQEVTDIWVNEVTATGEGMNVGVTYDDGTSETVTLDNVVYWDYNWQEDDYESVYGYHLTDNGLIEYWVESYYEDGEATTYDVRIFGQWVEGIEATTSSDYLIGDVNDDGVVNMKDVTLLRRYLAGGWDVTINLDAADVNVDDAVNMKDVTIIRRYLAGGWDVELG